MAAPGAAAAPRRGMATASRPSLVTSAAAGDAGAKAPLTFEPETLPKVNVAPFSTQIAEWKGDLLVIAVTEEDLVTDADSGVVTLKSDRLKALNANSSGALGDALAQGGFDGKQGSASKVVRVGNASGISAKYIALVGLGKAAKVSTSTEWGTSPFQALGTTVAALAKGHRAKTLGVVLLEACPSEPSGAIGQLASAVLLGGYESSRFKSKKSPTASVLESVDIVLRTGGWFTNEAGLTKAVSKAHAVAAGTMVTRYLVEAPPNVCTPTHLADCARHIAAKFPDTFKIEVLDKAACQAMNMGLYLGVAEASEEPPRFIHLTYTPKGGAANKKVAVVGKGLTFDSGGYNLKAGPGSMIELMKFDMGGAAATLGAARIVGAMQPAGAEIHFIVAACENMVAGKGLRPGDVLTGASGKTVEVNNTDAEGRLTLADALWFAQEKCGATSIVDAATLTGACIIALGNDIAGLFTPSDSAAAAVEKAAKAAGEKVWRMPFESGYFDQLKSACADMKNTGGRAGGSITAALFLKQFVKEEVEWAHLDIAGPVWDEKAGLPTGFGAATLAEWAAAQGAPASK